MPHDERIIRALSRKHTTPRVEEFLVEFHIVYRSLSAKHGGGIVLESGVSCGPNRLLHSSGLPAIVEQRQYHCKAETVRTTVP